MTLYTNNIANHSIPATITTENFQANFQSPEQIHIKDIFLSAKKQKIIIFATLFLSFLVSYFYTKNVEPVYRAGVSIQIEAEPDSIKGFNIYQQKTENHHFYQTQYDLLKSRSLARVVINQMKLDSYYLKQLGYKNTIKPSINKIDSNSNSNDKHYQQALVETAFLENLIVSPSKKSNIVTIYYDSHDPNLAANIANTLVDSYIQRNLEKSEKSITHAKKFLQEQLVLAKRRLDKSEKELITYAKENQIFGVRSNTSIVTVELQNISQAYSNAKNKLIEIESEYRQKYKFSGDMKILDNRVIQELKKRRSILESKYNEKSQIYQKNSLVIIELKEQIDQLKKEIGQETLLIKNGASSALKNSYLAAKQNVEMLKNVLEEKKKEQLLYRDKDIGYQTLEREVKTNRLLYDGLLQRMKEISVGSKIVPNNISIVDKAFAPSHPFKPNLQKNLVMAGVLGLSLGLLLAFIFDRKNGKLSSAEEVENFTKQIVLGVFPQNKQKNDDKDLHLILNNTDRKNSEGMKEAFRSIAFNIKQSIKINGGNTKIINIVSSAPSEGKSSTCINLATVIAQNGKKVLLIDADIRKPTLHSYLHLRNDRGLSDVVSGKAAFKDSILKVELVSGLYLLPAGSRAKNPAKILESQNFIRLLAASSLVFDQIIIDNPPVLGMTDSLITSNRADTTLFVFASEESDKTATNDALRLLSRTYANVAGIILTKYKETSKKKAKHNLYSYYHDYGNKAGEEMEPASKLILKSEG